MGISLLACALPEYMFVVAVSQWTVAKQLQLRLNLLENSVGRGRTVCDSCGDHRSSKALKPMVAETGSSSNNGGDVSHADEDGIKIDDGPYQSPLRPSGTLGEAEQGLSRLDQNSHTSPASNDLGHPNNQSGSPAARPKYTLGQAFFIVAGGLTIESKAFPEEARLTITPAGALEFARLRLLEPIPADVIDDKTKADPITKFLVCIQAGWFILQSIARVSQGLPLTLIEIHVLTHVSVALLMYLFWFKKPYDALSPLVITSQEVVDIAVLFSLHHPLGSRKITATVKEDRSQNKQAMRCVMKNDLTLQRSTQIIHTHVERAIRRLKANNQHLTYLISHENTVFYPSTYLVAKISDYKSNPGFDLVSQENFIRDEEKHETEPLYKIMPTDKYGLMLWILLLFISYGAFHLSAWNAHFPTTVERWFWRAAGLCIVGSLPLALLGTPLSFPFIVLVDRIERSNSTRGKSWARIVGVLFTQIIILICIVCFLPMFLAPVARLYFLIEAFISLRAPAPGTYETVQWTQFWPHW